MGHERPRKCALSNLLNRQKLRKMAVKKNTVPQVKQKKDWHLAKLESATAHGPREGTVLLTV